jgi:hypothetical protein
MTTISGNLLKMKTSIDNGIQYSLPVGDLEIPLNPLIGSRLELEYQEEIHCVACGRKTNKSFNQGYCYPCVRSLAQCDICIVRPEKCHYSEGTCREPEWADDHCMQEHIVYLANSSGAKVGITRKTQLPTRWIDQGAVQALPIFSVSTRYQSGLLEEILKQHVSDKTNWRKMLKNEVMDIDLPGLRDELLNKCDKDLTYITKELGDNQISALTNDKPLELQYPVQQYPEKVTSLNFDKTAKISGILQGIKGQYLLFNTGVLNIRKFAGYKIKLTCKD